MEREDIENLRKIAEINSSVKRLLILHALRGSPFLGHNSIKASLLKSGVKISSTEIYKHNKILIKHRLVEHIENKFMITGKGKDFLEKLLSLLESFKDWV